MQEGSMNDIAQVHSLVTKVVQMSRLRDDVRAATVEAQAVVTRFMYIIHRNHDALIAMHGAFEITRLASYLKQSADYITEILDNDAKAGLWLQQAALLSQ